MPFGEVMARSSATLCWRYFLNSKADESTTTTGKRYRLPITYFRSLLITSHALTQAKYAKKREKVSTKLSKIEPREGRTYVRLWGRSHVSGNRVYQPLGLLLRSSPSDRNFSTIDSDRCTGRK